MNKAEELSLAVEALRNLFDTLAPDGHVMVGTLSNKEVITVVIRGGCYEINVECESVPAMIKTVVDAVILKI